MERRKNRKDANGPSVSEYINTPTPVTNTTNSSSNPYYNTALEITYNYSLNVNEGNDGECASFVNNAIKFNIDPIEEEKQISFDVWNDNKPVEKNYTIPEQFKI